jgi:hypothetical protein
MFHCALWLLDGSWTALQGGGGHAESVGEGEVEAGEGEGGDERGRVRRKGVGAVGGGGPGGERLKADIKAGWEWLEKVRLAFLFGRRCLDWCCLDC